MPRTQAPDVLRFLENDHKKLRALLKKLSETTERGVKTRRELLARIGAAIRAHAKSEEEIFYPAYQKVARSDEDAAKFFEAAEEHALVDVVLPQLETTNQRSEVFGAKAKVLLDLVEHHAGEEEGEMFPRARKLFGKERLAELGAELAARHAELLAKHLSHKRKAAARR